MTIVLARDWLGSCCRRGSPEWPNPSQVRWLAPSATRGSGRTREPWRRCRRSPLPRGMGDTASSASGGSEVDVDVVQGRRGAGHRLDPPSGTSSARCSLHGAPQIRCSSAAGWAIFSPTCLPSIGNLVLVGTTPRGDKIVTSEQSLVRRAVCRVEPHRSMLWILDAGLPPKMGAKSPYRVFSRPGRRSGSVPPGPGDYGVRRARVGTVSSVSTVVAFSLDWLLARSRRRTTATAT